MALNTVPLDGFRVIDNADLQRGVELNIRRFRNQVSPFGNLSNNGPAGPIMIDTYYGLPYDSSVMRAGAIYGPTDALPPSTIDGLATDGFLRVPFRRIPRIRIRNESQLRAFVNTLSAAEDEMRFYFRGQPQEYLLPRSEETRDSLYGDRNTIEPSLLPSSARSGLPLEVIMPEWCWALRIFLQRHRQTIRSWARESALKEVDEALDHLGRSFRLGLLALALAQHYGLPSPGLDISDDLSIALFFAMNRFKPKEGSARTLLRVPKRIDEAPSVLYVFAVYPRFTLNYDDIRPIGFPLGRPDRQRAFFLHTGWGLSTNECARRLIAALYLEPGARFATAMTTALFPPPQDDAFANFLLTLRPRADSPFARYLERLYWVLD